MRSLEQTSLAYPYGIDNQDVREVRACINLSSAIIWTNMVIGWPIYNVAMVSMCAINHR